MSTVSEHGLTLHVSREISEAGTYMA